MFIIHEYVGGANNTVEENCSIVFRCFCSSFFVVVDYSSVLLAVVAYNRDRGIMRLCTRIISRIIGDLPHNWANPA